MILGARVLALGRYLGTVIAIAAVVNEHEHTTAYHIRYQREVSPNSGWFLARDVRAMHSIEGAE